MIRMHTEASMQTIHDLVQEHRAIEELLAHLERILDEARRDGQVDGEAAARLFEFLESEVDEHHQRKEELLLLRVGERSAGEDLPRRALREHAEERRLLALARDNCCGARFGEPNCVAAVERFGHSYLALQRAHSSWEERELFPRIVPLLDAEDDRVLGESFRRMDRVRGQSLCTTARALAEWLDQRSSPVRA